MKSEGGLPQTGSLPGPEEHSGRPLAADSLLGHVAARLGERRAALVAFSGGLDSSVLLDLLAALRDGPMADLSMRAVYIHHGLSAHADEWADHCAAFCLARSVPFLKVAVRVDPGEGGVEAAAREARYEALRRTLAPGETLLTAQHLDDQGETLLLALKRGSGPAGLSAMAAVAPFYRHELLRPLLDVGRDCLQEYALRRGLRWIEDESNQDDRFDRNFLRLRVMPLLKARWPRFSQAAARSAQLCAEQEGLLDELLGEALQQLTDAAGSLALAPLRAMGASRRGALLRRWLAAAGASMPSRDMLERLWREVALSRPDAEPCLQLSQRQIRRFRDRLYVLPLWPSLKNQVLAWPAGVSALVLPQGLGRLSLGDNGIRLRAPQETEQVTVRFTAAGVQHIVGRRHGRPIKKLWQELDVPPWQRERTPMLFYNDRLIAALGAFVTLEGASVEGRAEWSIQWRGEEDDDNGR